MATEIGDRYNISRQMKVNEDGSIDVNTTGIDVEIGAVEIKDGESDTRLDEDKMTLTINDDLTGLLYMRVGAGAKVETR